MTQRKQAKARVPRLRRGRAKGKGEGHWNIEGKRLPAPPPAGRVEGEPRDRVDRKALRRCLAGEKDD